MNSLGLKADPRLRGQSASTWEDQSLTICGMRARVTWSPRLGLRLFVGEADYYDSVSRESFAQDDAGNVSELDVRRARERLIETARQYLKERRGV